MKGWAEGSTLHQQVVDVAGNPANGADVDPARLGAPPQRTGAARLDHPVGGQHGGPEAIAPVQRRLRHRQNRDRSTQSGCGAA